MANRFQPVGRKRGRGSCRGRTTDRRASRRGLGLLVGLALLVPSLALAAPLDVGEALVRMRGWMSRHPVMRQAADRAVEQAVVFPSEDAPYAVYVVSLAPRGYVVLNSDDRLPPAVAFSPVSVVSIADEPDNAFRAALLAHVGQAAATLPALPERAPVAAALQAQPPAPLSEEPEVFGPYLATSWNQNHPYNLFCPDDPGGSAFYGYRAPTGCVPTAYAQVLYYHRWPLYGHGSHSYSDTGGDISGDHAVVFSDPFGWPAMQAAYDWTLDEQPGDAEVADLMYRLGVAAEANYSSSGTSSNTTVLGNRIAAHLYYEPMESHGNQEALLPALRNDLRDGYPAVVSIPGHAVVADGLLVDGTEESFHINYGWGGTNNGWWAANGVPGGAIGSGVTSIRPQLMALPVERTRNAFASGPIELEWILPVRRPGEAARLLIRQLTPQEGTWTADGSHFDRAVSNGWVISPDGRTGDCWYAGPNGYASLLLTDRFVPDASTTLDFWLQYRLGSATFVVSVSTDDGETFTALFERSDNLPLEWEPASISLGAYAGQEIQVRFELTSGSYYSSGGVWIDDLSVSGGAWLRWEDFAEDTELASRSFSEARTLLDVEHPELEGQPVHYTVLDGLPAGTYRLAALLEDHSSTQHALSPSFELTVHGLFEMRDEPDGSLTITGYNGTASRVVLPEEHDGKPVRGIAAHAFEDTTVTWVAVPAGVTALEDGAFAGAASLERVYFQGDAPAFEGNPFPDSEPTVFVLRGTSGWTDGFAGRPVALWNPVIHQAAVVAAEGFRIDFTGPPAETAAIEVSDHRPDGPWTTLHSEVLVDGSGSFTDPQAAEYPRRFYRIRLKDWAP